MPLSLSVVLIVGTVVLAPLNYVARPIFISVWQLVKHVLVIPCLLVFRIALYGTVYLPLTVVLSVANIPYDKTAPVELSLYRLLVAAWPHAAFLSINLLHYLLVSVIFGVCVGLVSGTNMLLVGYLLRWPEKKSSVSVKVQTTPFFNAKAEHTWDRHVASVKREHHDENTLLPIPRQSLNVEELPSTLPSISLHGLSSLGGLDAVEGRLSFPAIKEESEPEEPSSLMEHEASAGPDFPETFSTVPSLFSKGRNGDTFSTAVTNRAPYLRQHKQAG